MSRYFRITESELDNIRSTVKNGVLPPMEGKYVHRRNIAG
jgi:hypothetical protein